MEPVTVEGDRLVLNSSHMEVGKSYKFIFLGVKMVAIKSSTGAVNVYQVFVPTKEVKEV